MHLLLFRNLFKLAVASGEMDSMLSRGEADPNEKLYPSHPV